eukprot:evm.model.scf_248EXC.8 EVM.evm.TU.scf_248EXC.8   scf_248EXC:48499-49263(-)
MAAASLDACASISDVHFLRDIRRSIGIPSRRGAPIPHSHAPCCGANALARRPRSSDTDGTYDDHRCGSCGLEERPELKDADELASAVDDGSRHVRHGRNRFLTDLTNTIQGVSTGVVEQLQKLRKAVEASRAGGTAYQAEGKPELRIRRLHPLDCARSTYTAAVGEKTVTRLQKRARRSGHEPVRCRPLLVDAVLRSAGSTGGRREAASQHDPKVLALDIEVWKLQPDTQLVRTTEVESVLETNRQPCCSCQDT